MLLFVNQNKFGKRANMGFPSCFSPLCQSESKCEAFHMETRLAIASVLGPFYTFAEIHSTHSGALMHYSRSESKFSPTPVVNPDSSPPVQSPVQSPVHLYRPWENTRDLPIFIL